MGVKVCSCPIDHWSGAEPKVPYVSSSICNSLCQVIMDYRGGFPYVPSYYYMVCIQQLRKEVSDSVYCVFIEFLSPDSSNIIGFKYTHSILLSSLYSFGSFP